MQWPQTTNYPVSSMAQGAQAFSLLGSGLLSALVFAKQKKAMDERNKIKDMTIGEVLGFGKPKNVMPMGASGVNVGEMGEVMAQPMPGNIPTPGPMRRPLNPMDMSVARPMTPGAPASLQPLMGRTVREIGTAKDVVGDNVMKSLLNAMGVKSADGNELIWDGTSFQLPTGPVSAKGANVLLRQRGLGNAQELIGLRKAAEKRLLDKDLDEGQKLQLRADIERIKLLGSPDAMMNLEDNSPAVVAELYADMPHIMSRLRDIGVAPKAPRATPAAPPAAAPQAPKFKTADEVKAAYQAGKLDEATATSILQSQFGMQ